MWGERTVDAELGATVVAGVVLGRETGERGSVGGRPAGRDGHGGGGEAGLGLGGDGTAHVPGLLRVAELWVPTHLFLVFCSKAGSRSSPQPQPVHGPSSHSFPWPFVSRRTTTSPMSPSPPLVNPLPQAPPSAAQRPSQSQSAASPPSPSSTPLPSFQAQPAPPFLPPTTTTMALRRGVFSPA